MAANPLKAVDTIAITFTPTASGLRQAVYTLTLSDSSSITVSLEGTGIDPGPALSVTPPTLFDNDSIALCSQISRGMRVRSNACASKNVILEQISGAASGDYKIVKAAPDPLTGSDSVTILFTPTAGGVRNAQYELQVGAEKLTVPLAGKAYYPAYNFSFSTPSLFDSDTLSVCEKTQASFHITSSGCVVPKVASQTIAGAAPNDYLLLSVAPDSLTGDDVVTVQFAPGAFGARDAQYEITLSDGKKYVVYLKGTGKDGVYTITASPKILFEKDSLYSCEDAEHTADITLSGCTSIRAGSQTIIGAASTDYTLVTKAPDSLAGTNTIRIHFKPTAPGMRDAMYRLTLSDGKTLDITLSGYGKATETLSFSTVPSISTVVIGDDISVPITINGFSSSPLLRLSLAFDSVNLVYHGTRSAKGTMLDVAGTTTAASSQIEIPAGELQTGQVSAYANFNLYVDTEKVSSVTVSNLQVFGAESPCQYIVNNGSYETTIAGPTGCGTVVISDYLRYNNIPGLRIYPNPASGSFTIVSSEALGMARFEITDKLGIVHRSEQVLLGERGSSVKFDAGGLASGLYFVRIIAGPFNTALPVVIEK
jgi:hypothetical protein